MIVSLNGDKIEIKDESNLASVLGDCCFANRSGIAVALNNTVVPKSQWATTPLTDKDRILIIAATKGG
ncbi:MAG: sulfur carrier protein ThiS [Bacteroidales bacterium]|jgi:sulfur carrier protein|nr:sulfur carrier protein ThiS [Bacteroidales bacterium]